jgi:hypothetical protein
MFEAGAAVPYVMSQVGHSDSATTLEIYSQVLERRERRTVGEAFDRLMRDAIPAGADREIGAFTATSDSEKRLGLDAHSPVFGPRFGPHVPSGLEQKPINK